MTRHHQMANNFEEKHEVSIECSLCYMFFVEKLEGDKEIFSEKYELAIQAHKEGWRYYPNKQAEYEGQEVTIDGAVCPSCNEELTLKLDYNDR